MTAYYNENDSYCAAWLRNLISENLIAPGDVDERDIQDVRPIDLEPYDQCHFFAGLGGWSRALRFAAWPDHRKVWTGSCPCQPFSQAGKCRGFDDERHLWPHWQYLIEVCRPAIVFGEQVEAAIGWGWLDAVFADLEGQGYACGATVLPACGAGAPHIRQRCWFVADAEGATSTMEHASGIGRERRQTSSGGYQHDGPSPERQQDQHGFGIASSHWSAAEFIPCTDGKVRPVEPGTFPLAHGIPGRVGRLRAYGNAIVPQVAAEFIRAVMD